MIRKLPSVFLFCIILFALNKRALCQKSFWYNYALDLKNVRSLSYYFDYPFPDSTVKMRWTGIDNELHYVQSHSWGQVLDPRSVFFSNSLDQNTAYTLDSVAVRYMYFRYQHETGDTLVIQVFNHNKIHFNVWHGVKDTPFAYVRYDPILKRSPDPSYEYKYVLSDKDIQTSQYGLLTIPVVPPIIVSAGNSVAATFTYYPGNPYQSGDTIYDTSIPAKPINGFRIIYYVDPSRAFEEGIYNNGLAIWDSERYSFNVLGWNNKYHAECASFIESNHLDMAFKITSNTTGLLNEKAAVASVTIYPNPLIIGANCRLNLEINKPVSLHLSIFDMEGKLLLTRNEKLENMGENSLSLNNAFIEPGIYFIKLQNEDFCIIKKMQIISP